MIKHAKIVGFKSFKERDVSLGKLTVLTGLNNSGKSSLMQAIRMGVAGRNTGAPYIEGLGGYSELKSHLSDSGAPIVIELSQDEHTDTTLELTEKGFTYKGNDSVPFTQFISADRYGPRVQLPILREDVSALTVGTFGEYSAYYASSFENSIVAQPLRHASSASNTLKNQLIWWMGEISPGVKLDFDVVRKYDSSHLAVDGLRPTNSGFGISYVLPIILCLLTMSGSMGEDDSNWRIKEWFDLLSKHNGLLLIENPEAHLHPKGQTCIGHLIALAAAAGVQVIIETHSDHVLDGIRLAVKHESSVSASDIKIKYFRKSAIEESEITDVTVMEDGKLSEWPEGFFDQMSINLRAFSLKK